MMLRSQPHLRPAMAPARGEELDSRGRPACLPYLCQREGIRAEAGGGIAGVGIWGARARRRRPGGEAAETSMRRGGGFREREREGAGVGGGKGERMTSGSRVG
jgi:hypothetical protein